jgi:putative endonuclease
LIGHVHERGHDHVSDHDHVHDYAATAMASTVAARRPRRGLLDLRRVFFVASSPSLPACPAVSGRQSRVIGSPAMFAPPTTLQIGSRGEDRATAFLVSRGYRILERNVRFKCGELDIVASDGNTLCFVEVRYRSDANHGHPFETVTRTKRERVSRAAALYLQRRERRERQLPYRHIRFDLVAVTGPLIELLRDAWRL